MENELFKLVTRRYLAWGLAGIATLVLAFIAVWGAAGFWPSSRHWSAFTLVRNRVRSK